MRRKAAGVQQRQQDSQGCRQHGTLRYRAHRQERLGNCENDFINLTKVTLISSTGLQALVDIAQAMQQWPEPLRNVVDHTRPVIHPLKITGLHEILALFNTVSDALKTPR